MYAVFSLSSVILTVLLIILFTTLSSVESGVMYPIYLVVEAALTNSPYGDNYFCIGTVIVVSY